MKVCIETSEMLKIAIITYEWNIIIIYIIFSSYSIIYRCFNYMKLLHRLDVNTGPFSCKEHKHQWILVHFWNQSPMGIQGQLHGNINATAEWKRDFTESCKSRGHWLQRTSTVQFISSRIISTYIKNFNVNYF